MLHAEFTRYDTSIMAMIQHLISRSRPSGLVFVGERKNKVTELFDASLRIIDDTPLL